MADNVGVLCAVLGPDALMVVGIIGAILYSIGAVLMIPLIIMFVDQKLTETLIYQTAYFILH